MPKLSIPTPFRTYTGGTSSLDIEASDVRGAVQVLITEYPDLESHLFNENGNLRPFVNLYVNEEDVRYLQGLDTELKEQDHVRIIPSIAGGI